MRVISEFAAKATSDKELKEHCSKEAWNKWQAFVKKRHELDPGNPGHCNILRFALLDFIADFANWDNSAVPEYLETARALTQSAHESLGGAPGTRPLVVDPFAGGGSIPLEALRIGADAFSSDLNPVAILLNKVVLEYIPKCGSRLAGEVRKWGELVGKRAAQQLCRFYPGDPHSGNPLAYLWARTIRCEGPGCGAEIPLIRSFLLAATSRQSVLLEPRIHKDTKRVEFSIKRTESTPGGIEGTVKRGTATCPICNFSTPASNVKKQFERRQGGATDAKLLAVVRERNDKSGRTYSLPSSEDLSAVLLAQERLTQLRGVGGGAGVPDEPLPYLRSIFNVNLLGVDKWAYLFGPRQLLALLVLAEEVRRAIQELLEQYPRDLAESVATCLALAVDRQADYNSSLCRWVPSGEFVGNTFGRQALGIIWDFCEVNPMSGATGDFAGAISWIAKVCDKNAEAMLKPGQVAQSVWTGQIGNTSIRAHG